MEIVKKENLHLEDNAVLLAKLAKDIMHRTRNCRFNSFLTDVKEKNGREETEVILDSFASKIKLFQSSNPDL